MIVRSIKALEIIRIKVEDVGFDFLYGRANYLSVLFPRESDIPEGSLCVQLCKVHYTTEDSMFLLPDGRMIMAPCDYFEAVE